MEKKYIITYKMKPGRGCGAVGNAFSPQAKGCVFKSRSPQT